MNNQSRDYDLPDLTHLIEEADRLLEGNEFAAARDMFRAVCLLAPPTRHTLVNLNVAEEQEQLQFSRTLVQKYPDSLMAQLEEVMAFMRLGSHWNAHAAIRCTDILQALDLTLVEEHQVRRLRFRAATRTGYYSAREPYQTIVEDFSKLWVAGNTYHWAARSRQGMLQDLAAMNEPEATLILETLAGEDWLPPLVKQLLEAKIRELRILENVTQEYK